MFTKISFAAAVLLGLASATGFTKTGNIVNEAKFLTADYTYGFDIDYHTEYYGGPYTDSDAPSAGFQYELYSVMIESKAYLSLETTWFNNYQHSIEVELVPFKFSPYGQWFIWFRPEETSFDDTDFNIYASTWLEILTLTTTVTENFKTFETSVYDYIDDSNNHDIYPSSSDFVYNEDYENEYADPYWSKDFGSELLPASFVSKYMGEQQIYNWWVLGKYSW
jgi:hypothetical protein